jgi:hypothetical protein
LGAEFFHADRQTDMTKLISLFAILQMRLKWRTNRPAFLRSFAVLALQDDYVKKVKWDSIL